jgi:hypothetical protein
MADGKSTFDYLDAYCERAGHDGLWAEPINAITNLAFIAAAWFCFQQIRRVPFSWRVGDIWVLVAALFAIGVGSGLWHTHATQQTLLADVIPILIFMNVYLLAAMRRLFGLAWWKVGVLFAAYQGLNFASELYLPRDFMNGTVMYLPTFLTLIVMTIAMTYRNKAYGKVFEYVVLVWLVSLFFRTVDLEFCSFLPFGTHFLWHILNSVVLYRLLKLLIDDVRSKA